MNTKKEKNKHLHILKASPGFERALTKGESLSRKKNKI